MSRHNSFDGTRQSGFTLVELLVAMSIFSFMLLIVSVSFIGIVHISQAGQASATTQHSARIISETIQRQLRSAETATVADDVSPGIKRLCLYYGSTWYEYAVDGGGNLRLGTIPSASACASTPAQGSWAQVNDASTTVRQFYPIVDVLAGQRSGLVTLKLAMTGAGISSSEIVVDPVTSDVSCAAGRNNQFCSVTRLVTASQLRGGNTR